MNKEHTAVAELTERYKNKLVAIYRVGLKDESDLSDLDLILVFESIPQEKISIATEGVDLRGVFSRTVFSHEQLYLPYVEPVCIWGTPIKPATTLSQEVQDKVNLLKLSSLFIKSFFRNFYALVGKGSAREILIHLNDFNYAKHWLAHVPNDIAVFCKKINEARSQYPSISDQEAQRLLREGIDKTWQLAGLLNNALVEQIAVFKPHTVFTGYNPTLFAATDISSCRKLTEAWSLGAKKLKLAVLPLGFNFVAGSINPDQPDKEQRFLAEFAQQYATRNLTPPAGFPGATIKHALKVLGVYFLLVRYWHRDIYAVFDNNIAYAVLEAKTRYGHADNLLPAEKVLLETLTLPKDAAVLDAACGAGRFTFRLFDAGYKNTYAFDSQRQYIDEAKLHSRTTEEAEKFIVADFKTAKRAYHGKLFDAILVPFNSLDYVYPQHVRQEVSANFAAMLKPGGLLIFSSHNRWYLGRETIKRILQNLPRLFTDHAYLPVKQSFGILLTCMPTPTEVRRSLMEAGLALERIIPNNQWLFPLRDPFPYYVARKPDHGSGFAKK